MRTDITIKGNSSKGNIELRSLRVGTFFRFQDRLHFLVQHSLINNEILGYDFVFDRLIFFANDKVVEGFYPRVEIELLEYRDKI